MEIKANENPTIDTSLMKATFVFESPAERVAFINALTSGQPDDKEFTYGLPATEHKIEDMGTSKTLDAAPTSSTEPSKDPV